MAHETHDGRWLDTDKALEEANALGLTNETLKQFFLAQIQERKR